MWTVLDLRASGHCRAWLRGSLGYFGMVAVLRLCSIFKSGSPSTSYLHSGSGLQLFGPTSSWSLEASG